MQRQDDTGQRIERTLAVWQSRSARRLTRRDARQIMENVTGFFHLLPTSDAGARAGGSLTVLTEAAGEDFVVKDVA